MEFSATVGPNDNNKNKIIVTSSIKLVRDTHTRADRKKYAMINKWTRNLLAKS